MCSSDLQEKSEGCLIKGFTEEYAIRNSNAIIEYVGYAAQATEEADGAYQTAELDYFKYKLQTAAIDSYLSAMEEIGSIVSTDSYDVEMSDDEVVVNVSVTGEKRNAEIEIIYSIELPSTIDVASFTVNVDYTFGEQMQKAGLNTLLGMGTVFAVLILISLIITLFGFIPKLTQGSKKKKDASAQAMDNTIAQIVEKEEDELADDLELVAVISAAIAASEGASKIGRASCRERV